MKICVQGVQQAPAPSYGGAPMTSAGMGHRAMSERNVQGPGGAGGAGNSGWDDWGETPSRAAAPAAGHFHHSQSQPSMAHGAQGPMHEYSQEALMASAANKDNVSGGAGGTDKISDNSQILPILCELSSHFVTINPLHVNTHAVLCPQAA